MMKPNNISSAAKEVLPPDDCLAKTGAVFANTYGYSLLDGITDKGQIAVMERIRNALAAQSQPPQTIETLGYGFVLTMREPAAREQTELVKKLVK